jgi:hypothetical protein
MSWLISIKNRFSRITPDRSTDFKAKLNPLNTQPMKRLDANSK